MKKIMELSSEEGEIPMPINSVYSGVVLHGDGHAHQGHIMTHHYHHQHQHAHHVQEPPSSTTTHDHTNINPSSSSMQSPTNNDNLNGSNTIINNANGALNLEDKLQQVPYKRSDKDCNNTTNPNSTSNVGLYSTTKKLIKFKECLKNHAASMGGNVTDGCGEFMPSGEEGTPEALTCSACNCHRNFHRKEIVGENQKHYPPHSPRFYLSTPHHQNHHIISTGGKKVTLGGGGSPGARGRGGGSPGFLGYPTGVGVGAGTLVPVSRAIPMNMPYQVLGPSTTPSDQSDDHDHQCGGGTGTGGGGVMMRPSHNYQLVKKRFRTKFSQEQKEKMVEFAEKVGWKIQRVEDSIVQQFCQEIGVKRRVLKVWMHNNKLTLAKKNNPNSTHHQDTNNNINSSLV